MIPIINIINRLSSQLDAEDSERYTFNNDYLPAINYAKDYIVSLFNSIFAQNKLSEESLKELTKIGLWKTNAYSRFAFDNTIVGHDIWTILSVMPKCTYAGNLTDGGLGSDSVYQPDLSFLIGEFSAKRLTREQWHETQRNCFVAGSKYMTCDKVKEYAYVLYTNYVGGYTLLNSKFEIEISPSIPYEIVAMAYIKKPTDVTTINDEIEFPDTLLNFISDRALKFIRVKQGETIDLYSIEKSEENKLINTLT